MRLWKRIFQFYMGGELYMSLEFLWRGRSHSSMFLLGGCCFLLLGKLGKRQLPAGSKAVSGAALVTALELLTGLAVNQDHRIWDYRQMPLNFRGQICLPYSLLWAPLSLFGMFLYEKTDRWIDISLGRDTIKEKAEE